MKRLIVLLAAAALFGLAAPASMANMLIDDDFNAYVPGNLVPQGGWEAHSGAGANPVQVLADSQCYCSDRPPGNWIALVQGSDSREDVNKSLGVTMGPGDVFYAGFCVQVNADGALQDDNYFAHFKTSGTYFAAKVFAAPPRQTGNDFTFGFQAAGSGEVATVFWPTDFAYGTCHRVVTSYYYDTGFGEMWIDPRCDLGPDGNPKITDTGYSLDALVAYAFRQANHTPDPDPTEYVDNLNVATTWYEACCGCVPEPASLVMLGLGFVLIRRR